MSSTFFDNLSREMNRVAGLPDSSLRPATADGVFIPSPQGAFFAAWGLALEKEAEDDSERWASEDSANIFAIRGAYDDQADIKSDGYTAEDRRLELTEAGMSAEGDL